MKFYQKLFQGFLLISTITFVYSCSSEQKKDISVSIPDEINNIAIDTGTSMFSSTLQQYSKSIPSPVELTTFIKSSGIPYDKKKLHDPLQKNSYITNFKKALNTGVYGADICYITLYNKNREISPYFDALRKLMQDIEIASFIDFEKYQKIIQSPSDSIVNVLSMDFDKINDHLLEKKKGGVSWLILFGGWIESLHFATAQDQMSISDSETKLLKEKILEQKIVLEDLLFMLDTYKNDDGYNKLNELLKDLKTSFDKVEITYSDNSTRSTSAEGDMLVVEDNSSSSIVIDDRVYDEIRVKIQKIRKFVIEK